MPENKFSTMMYPYALGCLNSSDFEKFRSLVASGADFPYKELGEFQNLVSLLPSMLPYEAPPRSVKEAVAKELYYIKDEEKTQKTAIQTVSQGVIDWGSSEETETLAGAKEESVAEDAGGPPSEEPEVFEENLLDTLISDEKEQEENEISGEEKTEQLITDQRMEETLQTEETNFPEPEIIIEEKYSEVQRETESIDEKENLYASVEEITEDESRVSVETKSQTEEAREEPVILPAKALSKEESENTLAETAKSVEKKEKTPVKTSEPIAKKEEGKPVRSLGDFLADAEIKAEQETGTIEFEDYFAEARKVEIQKRQVARESAPARKAEPPAAAKPQREAPKPIYREQVVYRSKTSGKIFPIILFVLLTAAISYFYFNSELEKYKIENTKMTSELEELKTVSGMYKDVLNIFTMKDGRTFNLYGSTQNSYSYGKVVYSPSERKGFIRVASLPELKKNMSYQFWASIGGNNYLLHRFTVSNQQEFYPFSLQQINMHQYLRIYLTEEPATGSQTPSRTVLISGSN